MKKRNMVYLLVISIICMLMSPICSVVANDETESIEPATERMLVLEKIGVYNSDMLEKTSDTVTRKDFAEIAVKFYNKGIVQSDFKYGDMDEKSSQYAVSAVEYNLMDDGLSGLFEAEKTIVGADVIRLVVKVLGYDEIARYYGGYIAAAKALDLCEGVNSAAEVTFSKLADALVDAFYENVGEPAYQKDVLVQRSNDKYIEVAFDAKALKGKVEATDRTSLYSSEGVGSDNVKISSEIYNTRIDMNPFLGCTINFIALEEESTGEYAIIYVYPDDSIKRVEFSAGDIVSYANNVYRFFDETRIRTANLDSVKTVIYNGVEYSGYDSDDLKPHYGDVRLVDTDGNGKYDVIFINEYKTMIAVSVDRSECKVYDRNGSGSICYEDIDFLTIEKDDKSISVDSIKEGNVLQVYESKDAKVLHIKVSTKKISGTISEYVNDGYLSYIKIENDEYKVDFDYFTVYATNISVGMNVTAYVNCDGIVVFAELEGDAMELGYLVKGKMLPDEEILMFKIFTTENKLETIYSGTKKIRIDGVRLKLDKAIEVLSKGTSDIMPQLILFSRNEVGEIVEIDTPYNNQNLDVDPTPLLERIPNGYETDKSFRITYSSYLGTSSSKLWYKGAGYTFGRSVMVVAESATPVLVIPDGTDDLIRASSEEDFRFYMGDPSKYFKGDSEYLIEAYSFDDGFTADVIITKDASVAASGVDPQQHIIRMIRKIKSGVSDDGEIIKKLEVVGTGYSSTTIYATEEKFYKEVKAAGQSYQDPENKVLFDKDNQTYELGVGDIIWYDLNSRDEITNVKLIYDASETEPLTAFKASSRLANGLTDTTTDPMPRRKGDILDYPGIQFVDVYEIKDGYAKVTYENLKDGSVSNPKNLEFNIMNLKDIGDEYVIFLDKRTGKYEIHSNSQINNGGMTYRDIKDYKTYGKSCSRVIQVRKWGYPEAQFVIME